MQSKAMNGCPVLNECRFFNDVIENMPGISEALKKEYCLGDNTGCARFMIFTEIGKERLTDDVFPHERDKAAAIVRHFIIYGEMK